MAKKPVPWYDRTNATRAPFAQATNEYSAGGPDGASGPLGSDPDTRWKYGHGGSHVSQGLVVVLYAVSGLTHKGVMGREGALYAPYFFQCPPLETFAIDYAHQHTDYETIRGGQYSRRGGRALRTIQFDTLTVAKLSSFMVVRGQNVRNLKYRLIELVDTGSPFGLMVYSGADDESWAQILRAQRRREAGKSPGDAPRPEAKMNATLRSLRVEERGGEPDARYLNVAFTEYRDPVVESRKKGRPKTKGSGLPKYHVISKKTTLYTLAKQYYGDPGLAAALGKKYANKGLNKIAKTFPIYKTKAYKVGSKILIPKRSDLPVIKPKGKTATVAQHGGTTVKPGAEVVAGGGDENDDD